MGVRFSQLANLEGKEMRNLFILRGAPASGKSTWVKTNGLEPYTLSADNIRCLYQSPVTTVTGEREISQNNDTAVWKLLFELLERRMENGELVIVDATHYKSSLISRYKDLVHKYRYRVNVIDFSGVPEEECLRRNSERDEYKRVPEEAISKMYACLHDDSEVKKSYKVLTPEEAATLINSPLEPIKCDSEKVVIFGDIHGCYDPLKEYFDKNPFNDNYCYIFCGDYLDRGTQNKEVLEFLLSIYKKPNVFLLEGNHDRWLRMYASKDYKNSEKVEVTYQDFFVQKVVNQLQAKKAELTKKLNKSKMEIEELSKALRESWEENPDNKEVFYKFEKVNVPKRQEELREENSRLNKNIESLSLYIELLNYEKENSENIIKRALNWYTGEFLEEISLDTRNIIMRKLNLKEGNPENPIRSFEFLKNTIPQIKDLNKSELRQLCDRFIQMSYFTYNCHDYLVTHGGLPSLPDMKTPTVEMIKGVGKYEDHEKIDKQFIINTCGSVCTVHGHRNVMKVDTEVSRGEVYNLEGRIEFGGSLRVLELTKFKDNVMYNTLEIKNNNYIPEEKPVKEEKSDIELLKEMCDSKWVQVKNLKDNVISLNFTRDAFEKGKWDTITCHARGLFVNKSTGDVVARSFGKFFNYHQHETSEPAYMKEHIQWPLIGYKKENGFLGIISKYKGKVRFFTKSSDEGDYVNWFIGTLCDNYGITFVGYTRYSDIYNQSLVEKDLPTKASQLEALELMKNQLRCKLAPFLMEGYSYVFECIDTENDPHIIKYEHNKIILLEVFKNQLKEEHLPYDELFSISCDLQVHLKKKELEFNNWEDFEEWKDKFRQGATQWDCKHEGYVFEDQNNYRVKFKSSFYSFWKQMRSLKEILASGRPNKKIYKTKEEIQVVKLLEGHTKEELQKMSIIDIEDEFYERNN